MKRRWYNIFREDGKAVVLAMDHAEVIDVSKDLENPGEIITKAVNSGADALLTTFGVAQHFQKEIGRIGLILRIDGGTTEKNPTGRVFDKATKMFNVEDAIRLGADGVMCMGFTGVEDEYISLKNIASTAAECQKWGLAFGVEMIPGGFYDTKQWTIENVEFASRVGAEYGADFIKAPFIGDAKSYKKVVDNCYKPILVLGGGESKTEEELLAMVKEAMEAGCSGVIIGRNIWKNKEMEEMIRSIVRIVHNR
jgi:class I fructose-bisphosphate aldolase